MHTTRLTDRIISSDLAELAKDAGYSNGGYTTYTKYHIDYIYDNDENHPESHKAGEVVLENVCFIRTIISIFQMKKPLYMKLQPIIVTAMD